MAENMAGKLFAAKCDSDKLKYQVLKDDYSVIRLGFNLGTTFEIIIFFNDDSTDVHLVGRGFATAPSDKIPEMYKLVNRLNEMVRWAKFYVDDDGTIMAEDDGVIQVDSAADETFELALRMATIIAKEAYPAAMRAIFAS